LQNSLIGKNFTSLEDCKKYLEEFFAYKTRKFWKDEFSNCLKSGAKLLKKTEYIIE